MQQKVPTDIKERNTDLVPFLENESEIIDDMRTLLEIADFSLVSKDLARRIHQNYHKAEDMVRFVEKKCNA